MNQGFLLFKNSSWVVEDCLDTRSLTRFAEIKYFYANLVDYLRVVMCVTAFFTIGKHLPWLSACLIMGATLLDWVDGPIARRYNQSTLFGSGVDWLADILAQLAMLAWWAMLAPAMLPWLLIAFSIELTTCLFDFATTATARYPKIGRPSGFYKILTWCMPQSSYTAFGTFLWLAYPVFVLACCLDLSLSDPAPLIIGILRCAEYLLAVPALLYLWCELAAGAFIISCWLEVPRQEGSTDPSPLAYDDGPAGVQYLGVLPEAHQNLLRTASAAVVRKMQHDWDICLAGKKVFWVNLWQRSGNGEKMAIDHIEAVDALARSMVEKYYGKDKVELDGYGLIVNPVGSKEQAWHLDYTTDYSTILIPLTRVTPNNMVQYLVLPPTFSAEERAKLVSDPNEVAFDLLAAHCDYVSVRQLIARPFSVIKMDFGTIHRGIANTSGDDRLLFWVSVKKDKDLLPIESLVEAL